MNAETSFYRDSIARSNCERRCIFRQLAEASEFSFEECWKTQLENQPGVCGLAQKAVIALAQEGLDKDAA